MSLHNELPRQKSQTVLKKLSPAAKFLKKDYGDKAKLVLIAPDFRSFIWVKDGGCLTHAQEQLATDYLIAKGLQ